MNDRLVTQAICWRIERRDGVIVALTDHDRDLVIDGVTHRAAPGMTPSAIVRAEGLDADTMEVTGALGGNAFRRADLRAGRWDGARVVMCAIDWSDTAAVPVPLGEGTIGEVELTEHGFTAELRGAQARLEGPVSEATSAACRATLGDARCRVAMAGRRRFARVMAAAGERVTLDRGEPVANAYGEGVLRWFGGANGGLASVIEASAGAVVTLRIAPVFAVTAGTLVELIEGCDRRLATCAARFGNVANFRGEPYLPGIDLLTRYPRGMTPGARVLAAARTLVGVRFRVQGRDPALGLDCVGVVAVALMRAGAAVRLPCDYAPGRGVLPPGAVPAGMMRCDGAAAGDVLLCRVSPAQLHLAVRAEDGVIHADAQARRVVERPGVPPWPVEAAWRWTPTGG